MESLLENQPAGASLGAAPAFAAGWPADLVAAARPRDAADGAGLFAQVLIGGREEAVSRAELWARAGAYGCGLRAAGAGPGHTVVIIMEQGWQQLAAFLGALRVGAVPSFMPPPSPKQDPAVYWDGHRQLFARLAPGTLLLQSRFLAVLRRNLPDLELSLLVAEEAISVADEAADAFAPDPEAVAFLQHSSGTTGLKKGVALSHRSVLTQVRSYAERLALRPDDRIVSWLPYYHDMGLVACFLLPLVARVPLVLLDPFEWVAAPGRLFTAIARHRATLCWQPNFAFQHLCRSVPAESVTDSLATMRAWINCSEPCQPETAARFARQFAAAGVSPAHLQVCYAMAETVFAVTQTEPGSVPRVLALDVESWRAGRVQPAQPGTPSRDFVSTGRPLRATTVAIVDAEGRALPPGTVGTVAIAGDFLFSGYYRLEAESLRRLRGGWYYTADCGFVVDGELYITGRVDDLLIIHGRNFYAHELEAVVHGVPGTRPGRAVALGCYRAESASQELVIVAETDPGQADPELPGRIRRAVRDAVALVPSDVRLVPPGWLRKTTSGKLNRADNLARYLAEFSPSPHP